METYYSNVARRWMLTLLDFCFDYHGKHFNYPTIIFYQVSYELSVMWQASRRAYRLNQTEDCKVIYMAYENTLQAAALEIMAEKQAAASAIQGKFSVDGLTSMAKGIDPRVKLAQKLSSNDTSSRNTLIGMFDAMNKANQDVSEDAVYANAKAAITYYELMGITQEEAMLPGQNELDLFDIVLDFVKEQEEEESVVEQTIVQTSSVSEISNEDDIFASFYEVFDCVMSSDASNKADTFVPALPKPKNKKKKDSGVEPMSLFDILSA